MTMTTKETKTRTITLTGRPPVKIREDQWPIIACGSYEAWDNQYRFQANRTTDLNIRVRQHEDGRTIVYGVYQYDTAFQHERNVTHRVGYVLEPGEDVIEAIQRVGRDLIDRDVDATIVRDVVDECIADLPAVEL
jgi:hypothetical protein